MNLPSNTVTFVSNGGTAVANQIIGYGGCAVQPATPARTGYVFSGWYADWNLTIPYDFATAVTESKTLYAKWTIDYTSLGEAVTQAINMLEQKNAKSAEDVSAMIEKLSEAQASLTKKLLSVILNGNCGTDAEVTNVAYGETAVLPEIPVKNGYVLAGWYTDAECTSEYDVTTPVISDITLYAKWELDYGELEAAVEDAHAKINSGLYKNDIKFKLYKAAVKKAELTLTKRDATSPEEVQTLIQKIEAAEGKITKL